MVTMLESFKEEMGPAKELYTREIIKFCENFDALGKMTLIEDQDIETLDYIYSFEKLNGTSQKELDSILLEICKHMENFSRVNGIEEFSHNVRIWL